MSRPIVDPKAKAAQASASTSDDPDAVEIADPPSIELDINGVDTKLEAAAAAISRASSGINGGEMQAGPHYGLNQGRVVRESGPDGLPRRVRIVAPML